MYKAVHLYAARLGCLAKHYIHICLMLTVKCNVMRMLSSIFRFLGRILASLKVMRALSSIFRFFGRLLASLIVMGLTASMFGGIFIIGVFYHFSRDLPDYSQLSNYDPAIVTRLYASDGKLMAEYATEKRVYVPLSSVSRLVIQAFLSAEDRNFYSHTGIDINGIGRAAFTNIKSFLDGGHSLQGGSTITQQVVKNFLLTNEKSLSRKIKEAILAFRITQAFSKNRILELYMNEIYLGQGSYGVAAASLNYFNKSMDELSVEEAAFLAALPKAPSDYDPRYRYEKAKSRRDWVISRMLEDGYISDKEAIEAIAKPITVRARDTTELAKADFFAEEVRRQLASLYGTDVLYKGGLVVKTTLDPDMQKWSDDSLRDALINFDRRHGYRGPVRKITDMNDWHKKLVEFGKQDIARFGDERLAVVKDVSAEKANIGFEDASGGAILLQEVKWARKQITRTQRGSEVRSVGDVLKVGDVVIVSPVSKGSGNYALHQIPEVNGAMVALDPHTGRVLAMSGGYSYGGTEFNRATQAWRQPGSSFKPFVYLTGLENGFNPTSVILDAPISLSQGEGLPMWTPQNYKDEYFGPLTLRVALEKSRNTVTVRLAQALGIEKIMATAERFGIYDKTQRNFSVALGAQETTLLRLATAYGMLVNGGKKISPAIIERIDDRNGKTILRRDTRACVKCLIEGDADKALPDAPLPPDARAQILDPRVAYQIVSMMQGVVERGTATKAKVLGRPIAGKTGTTNESRDVWFMGFSPDLVAGIYIGYDKPETLGKKETGGSVALPGFVEFMKHALANVPSKPFRVPPGITFAKINLKSGNPAYYEEPGVVISEAFKEGEEPGQGNQDILYSDWNNSDDSMGGNADDSSSWSPNNDPRQRERWVQRYGSGGVNSGAAMPRGQTYYGTGNTYENRQPITGNGAAPARGPFGTPPEGRKPVNQDMGTGGLY